MKILVCISKAPDTTSKINFTEGNTKFDENGVQFIVNPYDEWYAFVRGLELKEQHGGTVTLLNVGPAANDSTIRKALAIGADDAVRINAEGGDSLFVAKQIANYAKSENYDLVLLGKETIDYNGAEVGGMVAELLDMPYVSFASKMTLENGIATIERDIQGGVEVVETSLPFVLSASKGLAEKRMPSMRGIMAARTKQLKVVDPIASTETASIAAYELPDVKTECKMIDPNNMDELVELLKTEAKVL